MKIVLEAESDDEEFSELAVAVELRYIADQITYGEKSGTVNAPWSHEPIGRWEVTE